VQKSENSVIVDFFRNEYANLVGYVRKRIADSADRDGEDIVQDVITNIFEAADIGRPIENLAAYVYGALKNNIIDTLRKRRETLSLDSPAGGDNPIGIREILADMRYDACSIMLRGEIKDRLYRAIDDLGDEQRSIIIMTEFEGRKFQEISLETGIPIGTLLARKSRAIARIRSSMHEFKDYMGD
jgi:RNA polymerase sigma factor (sigma-70 family)